MPKALVTVAAERRPTTFTPGATTDGENSTFPKLPRDEKLARLPLSSVAPTLITQGATAYGLSVPFPAPEFPAENTTLIPFSVNVFVAIFTGSLKSKTVSAEKLQLTTRTL